MGQFCAWEKVYGIDTDGDAYLGRDKCISFEKELCFELEKGMWKKHRSVFQDHIKYIKNDIVKPFLVGILHYAERAQEMNCLAK